METPNSPDHFSRVADDYAAYRPAYPAALVDLLADLAPGRDLAWDAGCGSGQLSVGLAHRFTRVIASDVSAEQLARAAPHPRVEYRRAGAEASGIPPGTVDLAVAAQAAHWFDLPAYYAEVGRVSRPGTILALVSYGLIRIAPEIDPLIDAFYESLGPHWPPERSHVESGYRSLSFPFAELPTPPLEMRETWTLAHALGYVGTWSALREVERVQDGPGALLEDFTLALGRAWGAPGTHRAVRWNLALRVGRVASTG
jgi:SAM-dependent methyltransferase